MAKLYRACVFTCVLLIFLASSASGWKHLHRGRAQAMAGVFQEKMRIDARIIKNLKIVSESDKVELFIMANELTNILHQSLAVINEAVPHIKNEQYRRKLGEYVMVFLELLHDLQKHMYESETKLQEHLVACLEKNADATGKFFEVLAEHHTDAETLISDKLRQSSNIGHYAIYKMFFYATFFGKPNKELAKEIDLKLTEFLNVFDKLKGQDDEVAKDELTHFIRFLTTAGEESIVKLEYWMNLHTKSDSGFSIVKETANALSEFVDKLHHLIESGKPVADILENVRQFYVTATAQMKKLADIVPNDTPGDQEYIRGLLIINLTASAAITDEIRVFLTNKYITKFNTINKLVN